MDELLELHRVNADRFTGLVSHIGDKWDLPTPCDEWSVRDLVNHLTSEQLWAPRLLAGHTVAEVGDAFDRDVLGDDPVASWRSAMSAALEAFAADGAVTRTVNLSRGPTPAHEYLEEMVMDLAIHGWDLAHALGVDEAIDPATVDRLLVALSNSASPLGPNAYFKAPLPTSEDADEQVRLLALLGRRA